MKKTVFVLIAALLLGAAAFAQESNFSSPRPQFLAFDLGAGFGYSLSDASGYAIGTGQLGGVVNFGFKIAVLDNFGVGFDSLIAGSGSAVAPLFAGIRLAYNIIPQAGAAIGFGVTGFGGSPSAPALSLGIYGDLFQRRSVLTGITTGFRLRLDYIAPAGDIARGAFVFAPAFSFGL
ncbi:MAG: hypothetical protein LBQ35_06320 [Spirochaetaceae bacterium]|jgi:hypothetical protein|nr:hypothetical protein [Spirochaetaceae bacterium]